MLSQRAVEVLTQSIYVLGATLVQTRHVLFILAGVSALFKPLTLTHQSGSQLGLQLLHNVSIS